MKKTRFYYVLVFTATGPVFVTKDENKYAWWNKNEKPKAFGSREYAEECAMLLTANGNYAVAVTSTYELDNHPYRYECGEFEWKYKENK